MKHQRIPKLLKHHISTYLQQQLPLGVLGALPTLMQLIVSPDLSIAKVYVSFYSTTSKPGAQERMLAQLGSHQRELQRYLARMLGKKLRKLPVLRFYSHTQTAKGIHVSQLLEKAGAQPAAA